MNFLHSIRADLVEKRLLPVVAVLAALVVLVPVGATVLSSSGSAQPVLGPAPTPTPPPGAPSPAKALAAVAGPTTPAATHYTKRELDPFRLPAGAAKAAAAAAAGATGSGSSATAVKVNTAAVTPTKTTVTTTPTKTTTTTTTTTPAKTTTPTTPTTPAAVKPAPAPAPAPVSTPSPKAQLAKLGARDSYSIDVNVIDATGPHSLSDLTRLSPLPSATNSLIEYLGVLRSGRAAAFLVNPATVVGGPGKCLPRPSNCQVLELKPGQLEVLSVRSSGGPVVQGTVAVTAWRVVTHSSPAAARQVRARAVKQGQTLVTQSAQPALTDVVYSIAQGAVSIVPAIVNALPSALTKLLGG